MFCLINGFITVNKPFILQICIKTLIRSVVDVNKLISLVSELAKACVDKGEITCVYIN